MAKLFEAQGLVKHYGGRAVVNDVSFDVNRGEAVGMLGPNGAGKTTAFRMCIGLIKPAAGRVLFDGRNVTDLPMHRRSRLGMSYLAQEPSLFRNMTVEDNLIAIMEMQGLGRQERIRRAQDALEEFGLQSLRGHAAYSLSGGERRRLEIARALCADPKIILLDEPFTGIDPIAVGEVQDLVVGLKYPRHRRPDHRPQRPGGPAHHRPRLHPQRGPRGHPRHRRGDPGGPHSPRKLPGRPHPGRPHRPARQRQQTSQTQGAGRVEANGVVRCSPALSLPKGCS